MRGILNGLLVMEGGPAFADCVTTGMTDDQVRRFWVAGAVDGDNMSAVDQTIEAEFNAVVIQCV